MSTKMCRTHCLIISIPVCRAHSLACKKTIGPEDVIWSNFKNFSRVIAFDLDYRNLRFRFSNKQYVEAIDIIINNREENMFA